MQKLHGLVAATHTPFHADGSLNLAPVEAQCAHLLKNGITMAFIGGSTGESHSVSLCERKALAERWAAVAKGTPMKVIVHAGANCLDDSATLARHAQEQGAIGCLIYSDPGDDGYANRDVYPRGGGQEVFEDRQWGGHVRKINVSGPASRQRSKVTVDIRRCVYVNGIRRRHAARQGLSTDSMPQGDARCKQRRGAP